jgi:hypothetical protein
MSSEAEPAVPSAPIQIAVPPLGPLDLPFAQVAALAGYMDGQTAGIHLPWLGGLPQIVISELAARFNASSRLAPEPRAGKPRFTKATEPATLSAIRDALQFIGTPSIVNLAGFEWIEIKPLIAGRYVTGRLPLSGLQIAPGDVEGLARFCVFGHTGPLDAKVEMTAEGVVIRSLLPFVLGMASPPVISGGVVTVQHQLVTVPQPIRVLLAHGRAVALAGLDKLVVLARLGFERALCLVHYGYSPAVGEIWPTVPQEVLDSQRPPVIEDFLNPELCAVVPTRPVDTTCVITPNFVREQ